MAPIQINDHKHYILFNILPWGGGYNKVGTLNSFSDLVGFWPQYKALDWGVVDYTKMCRDFSKKTLTTG